MHRLGKSMAFPFWKEITLDHAKGSKIGFLQGSIASWALVLVDCFCSFEENKKKKRKKTNKFGSGKDMSKRPPRIYHAAIRTP